MCDYYNDFCEILIFDINGYNRSISINNNLSIDVDVDCMRDLI